MASTWVNVRNALEGIAPAVAGLALGPIGQKAVAAALGVGNNPDEVHAALQTDPDAAVKLKALEVQAKADDDATEASVIASVQQTISKEAQGTGGWLQANWHALGSLWGIALVTGIYFLLPIWHGYKPEIIMPVVDPTAWIMIGAILGIKHWSDGRP